MMTPVKMHGEFGQALRPRDLSAALQVLYQCLGLLRRPKRVFLRRRYVREDVMGQPWGGRMTYCSSSGSTDWQNAWLTSPVLVIFRIWVAIAMRSRSLSRDMTGAKQSLLDQSCGSRLPRTTMQYFARSGFPFLSFLIFDIAMDGSALPTAGRRVWYFASVIYSYVWVVSWRPRYSSRYDLSQISLSFFDIDLWSVSFGSSGESRPAAETRRADEMISMSVNEAIEDFVLASDRLQGSEDWKYIILRARNLWVF